jgi:hypothetical protein
MNLEPLRVDVTCNGIALFRAMAARAGVEVLEAEAIATTHHRGKLTARCRHQGQALTVRTLGFGRRGGGQTGWELELLTGATATLKLGPGHTNTFSFWGRPEPLKLGDAELDEDYEIHATPPEAAEALRCESILRWLHETDCTGRLHLEGGRLVLSWTGDFKPELLSAALRTARAVQERLPA